MSDLQFQQDNRSAKSLLYARFQESDKMPAVVRVLISSHIVKTEKQAQVLLLIAAALIIAVSIYFIIQGSSDVVIRTIPAY